MSIGDYISSSKDEIVDLIDSASLVPVFGTLNRMCKIIINSESVTDRILAAKIVGFLGCLKTIEEKDRDEIVKRFSGRDSDNDLIGNVVLLHIESVSSIDSARLLGYLFMLFLYQRLSSEKFRLFCDIVQKSIPSDIVDLKTIQVKESVSDSRILRLAAVGLFMPMQATILDPGNVVDYKMTELGEELKKTLEGFS